MSVTAELALIRHFADCLTANNYADQRLYLLQHIDRLAAAPAPTVSGEPVAWRIRVTDWRGRTFYDYTERLPYEPLPDSGVKVRSEPEPLYTHSAPTRAEVLEEAAPNAMEIAQAGFDDWAAKPHNTRWMRKIEGTPIPNDLVVCIAERIRRALAGEKP